MTVTQDYKILTFTLAEVVAVREALEKQYAHRKDQLYGVDRVEMRYEVRQILLLDYSAVCSALAKVCP
jgi:hypothetical protein